MVFIILSDLKMNNGDEKRIGSYWIFLEKFGQNYLPKKYGNTV